ncbi:hypothetical protein [Brevundimonas denitrificans]|uniref:hypothetical protein n=1 Tax=Brevundimonas denitrificans TaxID=1443434 RepID=UPI00223A73C7|nr:hypothetical protein [Brevundimonas denitrificans]
MQKGAVADASVRAALVDIPRNRAITTDAVHVYANLIDFNDVLIEAGRETEASHRRALEFLHAHYRGCDELIDEFEMQRVDFTDPGCMRWCSHPLARKRRRARPHRRRIRRSLSGDGRTPRR